ncbi:8098_t:CDS:2, partial [Funneliformis mosseae]
MVAEQRTIRRSALADHTIFSTIYYVATQRSNDKTKSTLEHRLNIKTRQKYPHKLNQVVTWWQWGGPFKETETLVVCERVAVTFSLKKKNFLYATYHSEIQRYTKRATISNRTETISRLQRQRSLESLGQSIEEIRLLNNIHETVKDED